LQSNNPVSQSMKSARAIIQIINFDSPSKRVGNFSSPEVSISRGLCRLCR